MFENLLKKKFKSFLTLDKSHNHITSSDIKTFSNYLQNWHTLLQHNLVKHKLHYKDSAMLATE